MGSTHRRKSRSTCMYRTPFLRHAHVFFVTRTFFSHYCYCYCYCYCYHYHYYFIVVITIIIIVVRLCMMVRLRLSAFYCGNAPRLFVWRTEIVICSSFPWAHYYNEISQTILDIYIYNISIYIVVSCSGCAGVQARHCLQVGVAEYSRYMCCLLIPATPGGGGVGPPTENRLSIFVPWWCIATV